MFKPELTADSIYKKEFKTGLRGYVIEEVDGYLDLIIKDYENFEREIERLKKENAELKGQTPVRRQEAETPVSNSSNYDMLRRISNLEKAVFGRPHQEG